MANEHNPFEQRRIALHHELEALFGDSVHVYFQPPENLKMVYPAIIYERYNIDINYATNSVFNTTTEYHVTIVDSDPDSLLVDKMSKFKTAQFVRHYATNGLNHDIFKIFY